MEEIKNRYHEFLNLTNDGEEGVETDGQGTQNQVVDFDGEILQQENQEKQIDQQIDTNLQHEYDELKSAPVEQAYQDYNYWKPEVDYDLGELLNEANRI